MSQFAKIFINGSGQAVRLPVAYRFDSKKVFIRKEYGQLFDQERKQCL